jgi:ion channel-forming bestrophin family protein
MIVTRRISLAKLLDFTRWWLLTLIAFAGIAGALQAYVDTGLLRALSYAAGFLGTALAFLIGFRNNSAYGRWWEGHRIWSKLKYESRSFALMVEGLIAGGDATARTRRAFSQYHGSQPAIARELR